MDINFELYKIFYHAASSGSFSDAAQKLFISQSAVSQAIKNLESKIGGALLVRKGRSISLTGEGELLFKHIEQAYNFIKTAENKLYGMQNMDWGEVKIGVGDTICKYFLIPFLQKYNQEYPNVKIQVINRTSQQIIQLLKNGSVDLGIVTLPVSDKEIVTENFIEVCDIFVASDRFVGLKDTSISLKELVRYPLLMLQGDSTTRHNIDSYLNQKGIVATPEIELESIDLLVEFARIGLGIAHVLKESALTLIETGQLFEVKTRESLPTRTLGIATVRNVPPSRASEEFIAILK